MGNPLHAHQSRIYNHIHYIEYYLHHSVPKKHINGPNKPVCLPRAVAKKVYLKYFVSVALDNRKAADLYRHHRKRHQRLERAN